MATMSDLHALPLVGHDLDLQDFEVRARVWRGGSLWYWTYVANGPVIAHGPFGSWREAYDSAYRMVDLL